MGTQLFDDVIGEIPPSGVDVGGIVRREKRRRASRIATLVTAVVALSVTAGVGLTTASGAGSVPRPSVAATSPSSPAPAVVDTRFRLVANSKKSAKMTGKKLSQALTKAIGKEGTHWIYNPNFTFVSKSHAPVMTFKSSGAKGAAGQMFAGSAAIGSHGHRGSLHLLIFYEARFDMSCSHTPHCTLGRTPSGAKYLLIDDEAEPSGNTIPAVLYTVQIKLPDGRILNLDASNSDGSDKNPPPTTSPLTINQLLAIGTDVASRIKA